MAQQKKRVCDVIAAASPYSRFFRCIRCICMFFRFGRQEAHILFKAALIFSVVREQRANDREASQRNGKRKRYHPQQWIAHQYGGHLIDGVRNVGLHAVIRGGRLTGHCFR